MMYRAANIFQYYFFFTWACLISPSNKQGLIKTQLYTANSSLSAWWSPSTDSVVCVAGLCQGTADCQDPQTRERRTAAFPPASATVASHVCCNCKVKKIHKETLSTLTCLTAPKGLLKQHRPVIGLLFTVHHRFLSHYSKLFSNYWNIIQSLL